VSSTVSHTLDSTHGLLFDALTGQLASLGFPAPAEPIPSIVEFLASPLSGILLGAVGPVISPDVALANSIEAVVGDIQSGDSSQALSALLATPANMLGAFFNGATLNLDALIPAIEQANIIPLPEGTTIDGLSFAFGGLLSTGVTQHDYTGAAGEIPSVGGSILNSLGIDLSGAPIVGTVDATANPVGPLGALEGLSQLIGVELGDGWDGKNAAQLPPLSELTLPTLTDDGGASTLASSLGDLLQSINLDDLGGTDLLSSLSTGLSDLAATLPHELVTGLLSSL
jgi:hypothetical protein